MADLRGGGGVLVWPGGLAGHAGMHAHAVRVPLGIRTEGRQGVGRARLLDAIKSHSLPAFRSAAPIRFGAFGIVSALHFTYATGVFGATARPPAACC